MTDVSDLGHDLLNLTMLVGDLVTEAHVDWYVLDRQLICERLGYDDEMFARARGAARRRLRVTKYEVGVDPRGEQFYVRADLLEPFPVPPDGTLPLFVHPGALRNVRSLAAEMVAAAYLQRRDPAAQVRLRGGRGRGWDARAAQTRPIDAKALTPLNPHERLHNPGCSYKLTRADHALFDVKTGELDLGCLWADAPNGAVTFTDGVLSVQLDLTTARFSVVPAERVNALLNPGCGARVVPLPDEILEEFEVLPMPLSAVTT